MLPAGVFATTTGVVDLAIDSRDGDHKVLEAAAEVLATQPVLSH
jgi:hypothetical protein